MWKSEVSCYAPRRLRRRPPSSRTIRSKMLSRAQSLVVDSEPHGSQHLPPFPRYAHMCTAPSTSRQPATVAGVRRGHHVLWPGTAALAWPLFSAWPTRPNIRVRALHAHTPSPHCEPRTFACRRRFEQFWLRSVRCKTSHSQLEPGPVGIWMAPTQACLGYRRFVAYQTALDSLCLSRHDSYLRSHCLPVHVD